MEALDVRIKESGAVIDRLLGELQQRVVGQKHLLERLVMALIAEGHVLLEGLPGLAKTTSVKTLADATSLSFSRIQFTPDLLPADVVGTQIYDPRNLEFQVRRGPVFANLVLADEINRAPAKVQSALLEVMQERQVTIGDKTFSMERPFLVLATQNPIEQEGTYSLPEAQVDRFLFKVKIGYGTMDEERQIIERMVGGKEPPVARVVDGPALLAMRDLAGQVTVTDKLRQYIVQVVFATREPARFGLSDMAGMIAYGASPRASISLEKAARVNALMRGRSYVTPQDIKDVGPDVLRHRIIPTFEAEAENISADNLVTRIFERVDVP